MQNRHCRPLMHDPCLRRVSADSRFPASGGLSPDAAARPGAMARLILRRVGIAPLLSLFAAPLLAMLPADPAHAQASATAAIARVVILPRAIRVQQGQVSVSQPGGGPAMWRMAMPPPWQRPCAPQDALPTSHVADDCRMIITDMP